MVLKWAHLRVNVCLFWLHCCVENAIMDTRYQRTTAVFSAAEDIIAGINPINMTDFPKNRHVNPYIIIPPKIVYGMTKNKSEIT